MEDKIIMKYDLDAHGSPSFPNQQQSMAKKFVKVGPGEHKEMLLPRALFRFLCYHLRVIAKKTTI